MQWPWVGVWLHWGSLRAAESSSWAGKGPRLLGTRYSRSSGEPDSSGMLVQWRVAQSNTVPFLSIGTCKIGSYTVSHELLYSCHCRRCLVRLPLGSRNNQSHFLCNLKALAWGLPKTSPTHLHSNPLKDKTILSPFLLFISCHVTNPPQLSNLKWPITCCSSQFCESALGWAQQGASSSFSQPLSGIHQSTGQLYFWAWACVDWVMRLAHFIFIIPQDKLGFSLHAKE
jgi:hypothetical protein